MNKIGVLRFANHCIVFLYIFYNIYIYIIFYKNLIVITTWSSTMMMYWCTYFLCELYSKLVLFIGFYFLKQFISDLFQPLPSFFHLLSAVSLIFTSVSFRAPTDAPKCELLFGFPKTSRSSSPSSYSVSSTRDRTHGFSTSPRMYSKMCHKMWHVKEIEMEEKRLLLFFYL